MKKSDLNGVYIKSFVMEVKQLVTFAALDKEGYLQPPHQHYPWKSQWPLKLHPWQRTRCMALSTQSNHNQLE